MTNKASTPQPEPPNELTVRRVQSVDAALVAALDLLFDEGMVWDEREGQRFLVDSANLLVVAFWGDVACGFATAHRLQRVDRRRAEVLLYEIGVAEAYRRRGIGAALVDAVNRWAADAGADEVWVLAKGQDAGAIAFYRAIGGQPDEEGALMFTFPTVAGTAGA